MYNSIIHTISSAARQLEVLSSGYFASILSDPEGNTIFDDQMVEVSECGTGFMLIKRKVFEVMFLVSTSGGASIASLSWVFVGLLFLGGKEIPLDQEGGKASRA